MLIKIGLPFCFRHANCLIHKAIPVYARLKYPDTDSIFAMINSLQLIINFTYRLGYIYRDTDQ